jgi:hypothetical protein
MPSWFFEAYEIIFFQTEVWLAALIVLACARGVWDDIMTTMISLAAGLYVGSGLVLGVAYMAYRTMA